MLATGQVFANVHSIVLLRRKLMLSVPPVNPAFQKQIEQVSVHVLVVVYESHDAQGLADGLQWFTGRLDAVRASKISAMATIGEAQR